MPNEHIHEEPLDEEERQLAKELEAERVSVRSELCHYRLRSERPHLSLKQWPTS